MSLTWAQLAILRAANSMKPSEEGWAVVQKWKREIVERIERPEPPKRSLTPRRSLVKRSPQGDLDELKRKAAEYDRLVGDGRIAEANTR